VARHSDSSLKSDTHDGIPGFPIKLIIFMLATKPGCSIYLVFKIKNNIQAEFFLIQNPLSIFSSIRKIKLKS
jgi:hypothetical protein